MPSCEIKLVNFEEANYFSTNTPPQGGAFRPPLLGLCGKLIRVLICRGLDSGSFDHNWIL